MRIFRKLAQLLDVDLTTNAPADGDSLTYDSASSKWVPGAGGGGGGAPTDVNYLVGTASGDLSAEIVVGTSPGGELGGTWASPTVDATHSGSSHASVQAAAEATAASALSTHSSDTTGVHGIADTSALETTAGAQAKVDAHVNDTTDAHDASAISVLDTAANFTGTDVEAVLAELQDNIDAGGGGGGSFTVDHSADVPPASANAMDDEFDDSSLDAKWSWRNQGSASWAEFDGWGQLTAPQNSGQSLRSIVQSVSGTFDIRAKVSFMPHAKVDFYLAGLSVWNNSSGKGYFLAFFQNASSFDVGMWPANSNTSLGTVIGQTNSANIVWLARVQYMRFVNDGTNITGYMSIDGRNWRSLGWTAALATHIGSIDRVGITMDNENSGNGDEWIVAEWFRRIS